MAKIMIVEDSSLMISVIKNFIKKSGREFAVIEAHNGDEGIQMYKAEKPDLVFMDIKMPGTDGMVALEKIREFDNTAKVVMCTSLKEPDQEEKAKKFGAVGYITKPFSSEDIIGAINTNIK
jgi:two-component system, chemotaxis family, chemotaxis protein CheY